MYTREIKVSLLSLCVLLLSMFAAISVVHAQSSLFGNDGGVVEDDISRANKFFNECVEKPVFNVSDKTNLETCACASAQVEMWEREKAKDNVSRDFLTPAQARAELTEEVLMLDIYAPCLHIPAREILYGDCAVDTTNVYSAQGDPNRLAYLCNCMANGFTSYIEYAAEPFLKMKHAQGVIIYDPIKTVTYSSEYQLHKRDVQQQCYDDYYKILEKTK